MFGLSKRERYEKNVVGLLHALFGDISGVERNKMITPKLKGLYRAEWDGVIDEGVNKHNPPELTALILAVVFYKDMIKTQASKEDLATMRTCILEKNHDHGGRPAIMAKLEITTLMANSWANREIDASRVALALRDIHRAIFDGNDEHLNDTVTYFVDGGNRLKAELKEAIQ